MEPSSVSLVVTVIKKLLNSSVLAWQFIIQEQEEEKYMFPLLHKISGSASSLKTQLATYLLLDRFPGWAHPRDHFHMGALLLATYLP